MAAFVPIASRIENLGRFVSCSFRLALLLLFAATVRAVPADHDPEAGAAFGKLTVTGAAGRGTLPLSVSADWTHSLPQIAQALVLVPSTHADAETSLRLAHAARYAAGEAGSGTIIVLPWFLAETDAAPHAMSGELLRWRDAGWINGEVASGPVPLSSLDAIDAIAARLADAAVFPNLRRLVIAGHSAGAQLVQRYAVVGRGTARLAHAGIAVRYVVANPSSYLWFGEERPVPVSAAACAGVFRWPYGLTASPAYVEPSEDLEARYISRDVVYLLGEADTDPNAPSLDRTCAAEAQGPTRYARGMNYLFMLEQRHPNLVRHRILSIWSVGHDAASMFMSACGLAALFDRPGCTPF
jgi:hypothetical protein